METYDEVLTLRVLSLQTDVCDSRHPNASFLVKLGPQRLEPNVYLF